MQFHVVLWALLLAVTDGPPTDKATELTACPLTNAVLKLKVANPSETCKWMKDTNVLYETRNTAYTIKTHESYEILIILNVTAKDNGTYECHIGLSERIVIYNLHVRSQEECQTREDNNLTKSCCGSNLAQYLSALFSCLAALFGAYSIFYPILRKKICDKLSDMIMKFKRPLLSKTTSSDEVSGPIQVQDGNEGMNSAIKHLNE